MAQNLTGYPSIDKPWLKYYSEEDVKWKVSPCTIYDFIWERNKTYLHETAMMYMGKKYTYGDMFENIDRVAKSFQSLGIGVGDKVAICSVTTPEIIYAIYALNKIGATVNLLEPRNNSERIKQYLLVAKSEYMVMIDRCYPKISSIIADTQVKKVIVVSPVLSASVLYKFGYLFKKDKIPFEEIYEKWSRFIARGNIVQTINKAPYDENRAAVIVYTGGTTGIPKGAMLSDSNLNHIAEFAWVSNTVGRNRQDDLLMIMPPFIAYGLCCGIHAPLFLGKRMIIIPNFKAENFTKLVLKHKPNHVIGVPSFFEALVSKKKKVDLSFICGVIAGGDKLAPETENRINSYLKSNNASVQIQKGYGMTELSSGVAITNHKCNKIGSVGIPLIGNNVKVIDPITKEEKKYNEQGEICISTPTIMLGYLNNKEETNKVVEVDKDGVKWVHTGDVGYVDEDGYIFIIDRMKRMIIRPDGHNVFPSLIESIVSKSEGVEQVAVVGMLDRNGASGRWPVAHVVVKPEYKGRENIIEERIKTVMADSLPERDKAEYVMFHESLPLTPVGKVDYRALEQKVKNL